MSCRNLFRKIRKAGVKGISGLTEGLEGPCLCCHKSPSVKPEMACTCQYSHRRGFYFQMDYPSDWKKPQKSRSGLYRFTTVSCLGWCLDPWSGMAGGHSKTKKRGKNPFLWDFHQRLPTSKRHRIGKFRSCRFCTGYLQFIWAIPRR